MNTPQKPEVSKDGTHNNLIGTIWRHRRKGGKYRVTQLRPSTDDVYLEAQTKGCRSTWKAECLLPFDYEQVSETNP